MITIEVSGVEEALRRLGNLRDRLELAVFGVLMDSAGVLTEEAKAYAPIHTGNLRRSIQITEANKPEMKIVVSAQAPYSGFVEWGSSKMAAQPFMQPAASHAAAELPRRVADKIRETTT